MFCLAALSNFILLWLCICTQQRIFARANVDDLQARYSLKPAAAASRRSLNHVQLKIFPQHINKLLHGDNSDVSAPTIQNDVIIAYWPKQRHVLLLFSTPKLCKTKVSQFLPALRYCSYSPHRYALRGLFFVYNFAIKFILTVKIKFNGWHLSQVKITQFAF